MKCYYWAAVGFHPVDMHDRYTVSFVELLQFKNIIFI